MYQNNPKSLCMSTLSGVIFIAIFKILKLNAHLEDYFG